MPGIVEDHVKRTRESDDLIAQHQLLYELQKSVPPWENAQKLATLALAKLEAANPGISYTELLDRQLAKHGTSTTKALRHAHSNGSGRGR